MSQQHQGYIPIDQVVNDYILEAQKSVNDYYRLWQLAFRGMDDLGLYFFYYVKSSKLPVNANMTVTLPSDFLQWTKVGVLNPLGEVIPLWQNDKLSTFADIWPNRTTVTQDQTNLWIWGGWNNTWCNYWNGYAYVNVYGYPSGLPIAGSFKVDTVNGVILLNEDFKYDYVILEYLCSPKQGEDYYIPQAFREALIAWIRWRDIISIPVKSHMDNANVMIRRKDYFNERRIASSRWKPVRLEEMYQASQQQTRMAIKS